MQPPFSLLHLPLNLFVHFLNKEVDNWLLLWYNGITIEKEYFIMTEIGKFLKKLRVENGEVLMIMSRKLDVTPSFLSAVELGKKKMPYEWNLKIREAYALTGAQENELDEAIAASEKAVILNLEEVPPVARKLAVSFARSFGDFTDEQLDMLKKLMKNKEDE